MIACIANPTSAGGRTASKIPEIVEGLRSRTHAEVQLMVTQRRGHAEEFARTTCRSKEISLVVAIGGDGSYQEIANGLVDPGHRGLHSPPLGFVSSGTGQGLAQGLGLPRSLAGQLDVIVNGSKRRMDLGHVRYTNSVGSEAHRYFINESQCGIGGAVVREVESRPKQYGGRLVFGLGALKQTVSHPNQCVRIRDNTGSDVFESIVGIVIGNGAFTGGGMNLTPGASPFDGTLNLLVMRAQTTLERWRNLSRIYSARHVHFPEFSLSAFTSLSLDSDEFVPLEADGEFLGTLPCAISIEPAAIEVIVPGVHS